MAAYLLRLVERARSEGRIAGTAEILETGEVVPVRNLDELVDVLLGVAAAPDRPSPGR
jgi:hypothetical protein